MIRFRVRLVLQKCTFRKSFSNLMLNMYIILTQ